MENTTKCAAGCGAAIRAYDPDDAPQADRLCPRCWDEWLDLRHRYDDERDAGRRLNEEREASL